MSNPPDREPAEPRASLAGRVERAASALNPFLMILVVGLALLDVTLYVGLSVSREPYVWVAPHQGANAQAAASSFRGEPMHPAR